MSEVELNGEVSGGKMSVRDFAVIRFMYFDAVGTILHPTPSVSEIYQERARKYGYFGELGQLKQRIREAFTRQEILDGKLGWKTDDRREFERWKEIVSESFPEMQELDACFMDLYKAFGTPEVWSIDPDLERWIDLAQSRNIGLGIASNFDHRLRNLINFFPQLKAFSEVVISSEVGWRKPASKFYDIAVRHARVRPSQILFLGDNFRFDVEMPRQMGMVSALVGEFAAMPEAFLASENGAKVALRG